MLSYFWKRSSLLILWVYWKVDDPKFVTFTNDPTDSKMTINGNHLPSDTLISYSKSEQSPNMISNILPHNSTGICLELFEFQTTCLLLPQQWVTHFPCSKETHRTIIHTWTQKLDTKTPLKSIGKADYTIYENYDLVYLSKVNTLLLVR